MSEQTICDGNVLENYMEGPGHFSRKCGKVIPKGEGVKLHICRQGADEIVVDLCDGCYKKIYPVIAQNNPAPHYPMN